jgi:hypothetical protein
VAKVASLEKQLKQLQMVFNDYSKSNGCIQSSIKWRVYTESKQTHTLQMMTKDMAFMYNGHYYG